MARKKTKNALELILRDVGDDPDFYRRLADEELNAHVARMIYDGRNAALLTQQQLADLVGTSASVINDLEESDYEGNPLALLRRIAEALKLRLEIRFRPARPARRRA